MRPNSAAAPTPARRPWQAGSVLLITATLLAIGCAKPTRVPLRAELRTQINSVRTMAGFQQQEIGSTINSAQGATAGQFGLIGAFVEMGIDSSRTKSAESAIVPVRNALIGYDPGTTLAAALKNELAPLAWLKGNTIEVKAVGDTTVVQGWLEKCGADVLLVIRPNYSLTPKFDGVLVTAEVSLHPRNAPLTEAQRPLDKLPGVLYYNDFTTTHTLADWPSPAPKDLEEAAKLWSADKGQKGRAVVDAGMAELARMIAYDLEQPGSTEDRYEAPAGAKTVRVNWKGYNQAVPVVHEGNGRVWARHSWGSLYSLKQ